MAPAPDWAVLAAPAAFCACDALCVPDTACFCVSAEPPISSEAVLCDVALYSPGERTGRLAVPLADVLDCEALVVPDAPILPFPAADAFLRDVTIGRNRSLSAWGSLRR